MTPVRYLVLWLTDGCNLSCSYCYGASNRSGAVMSPNVAERALRLAASSGLPFHVQMAGGEPTLRPDLVDQIAGVIRDHKWPATIGLQTNGALIDTRLLRSIKSYGIQVGISVDGPPALHEQIRGAARDTFRGMKFLSDHGVEFRVTTVVSLANVDYLSSLAVLLAGFSTARGIGLDLLVGKGGARTNCVQHSTAGKLKEAVISLMDTLDAINPRRSVALGFRELDRVKRALAGPRPRGYCHACLGESVAVAPDGAIYPCSQTVGDQRFYAGTLDSPDWRKLRKLGQIALGGENCSSCPLDGRCPGDCASRQFYNEPEARRLACALYQTLCDRIVSKGL